MDIQYTVCSLLCYGHPGSVKRKQKTWEHAFKGPSMLSLWSIMWCFTISFVAAKNGGWSVVVFSLCSCYFIDVDVFLLLKNKIKGLEKNSQQQDLRYQRCSAFRQPIPLILVDNKTALQNRLFLSLCLRHSDVSGQQSPWQLFRRWLPERRFSAGSRSEKVNAGHPKPQGSQAEHGPKGREEQQLQAAVMGKRCEGVFCPCWMLVWSSFE